MDKEQEKIALIVQEPVSEQVEKMLGQLAKFPRLEQFRLTDPDEAVQTIKQYSPCIVVGSLIDTDCLMTLSYLFSELGGRVIEQGQVRPIITNSMDVKTVSDELGQYGVQDLVKEPAQLRVLLLKTQLHIKTIMQSRGAANKTVGAGVSKVRINADRNQQEINAVTVKDSFIEDEALTVEEDAFLFGNDGKVLKQGEDKFLEMFGPDPSTGEWKEHNLENPDGVSRWRFVPHEESEVEESSSGNGWVFEGEKPVFNAESKKWGLNSDKPNLSLYRNHLKEAEKIRTDEKGNVVVAKDSEQALSNVRKSALKAEEQQGNRLNDRRDDRVVEKDDINDHREEKTEEELKNLQDLRKEKQDSESKLNSKLDGAEDSAHLYSKKVQDESLEKEASHSSSLDWEEENNKQMRDARKKDELREQKNTEKDIEKEKEKVELEDKRENSNESGKISFNNKINQNEESNSGQFNDSRDAHADPDGSTKNGSAADLNNKISEESDAGDVEWKDRRLESEENESSLENSKESDIEKINEVQKRDQRGLKKDDASGANLEDKREKLKSESRQNNSDENPDEEKSSASLNKDSLNSEEEDKSKLKKETILDEELKKKKKELSSAEQSVEEKDKTLSDGDIDFKLDFGDKKEKSNQAGLDLEQEKNKGAKALDVDLTDSNKADFTANDSDQSSDDVQWKRAQVDEEHSKNRDGKNYEKNYFYRTLAELQDESGVWKLTGENYVYIGLEVQRGEFETIDSIMPLWVFQGEEAPEFIEQEQRFRFLDKNAIEFSTKEDLPFEVRDYLADLIQLKTQRKIELQKQKDEELKKLKEQNKAKLGDQSELLDSSAPNFEAARQDSKNTEKNSDISLKKRKELMEGEQEEKDQQKSEIHHDEDLNAKKKHVEFSSKEKTLKNERNTELDEEILRKKQTELANNSLDDNDSGAESEDDLDTLKSESAKNKLLQSRLPDRTATLEDESDISELGKTEKSNLNIEDAQDGNGKQLRKEQAISSEDAEKEKQFNAGSLEGKKGQNKNGENSEDELSRSEQILLSEKKKNSTITKDTTEVDIDSKNKKKNGDKNSLLHLVDKNMGTMDEDEANNAPKEIVIDTNSDLEKQKKKQLFQKSNLCLNMIIGDAIHDQRSFDYYAKSIIQALAIALPNSEITIFQHIDDFEAKILSSTKEDYALNEVVSLDLFSDNSSTKFSFVELENPENSSSMLSFVTNLFGSSPEPDPLGYVLLESLAGSDMDESEKETALNLLKVVCSFWSFINTKERSSMEEHHEKGEAA